MFKKLRKDFVFLNMIIIGSLMISTFLIVYFMMYQNTMANLKSQLLNLPLEKLKAIPYEDEKPNEIFPGGMLPADYDLSFNLFLDADGKLTKVNSYVNLAEETYEKAAKTVVNNQKKDGITKLENRNWMYHIHKNAQLPSDGMQNDFNSGQVVVFLDITDDLSNLNNLLIIFFIVSLVMFIVIYIISVYFANRSIKGIEESWHKQKQFVEDASHEFKTPIAVIEANTDALLLESKNKNNKWIDYIKIETKRMNKLVTDLLYLAKSENTDLLLEKIPFDLSEVVNKVIRSHEVMIFEKELRLESKIEKDLIYVGDAAKIEQVLIILIENAIKYTNEKGKIKITLIKDKKTLLLSVANTGKGIKKANLTKVFDRFYKEDLARTGTDNSYGLGLSIAKTIIERMGGKINLTSNPNKITEFTIILKIK